MEANQELNNLYKNSNSVFYFLRRMKKEGKDLEGGRCLRGRRDDWVLLKKIGQKFGTHSKDHERREQMGPHGGN